MKITAVGVGGAFTEKLYHNCYMLSENDKNLFVDFGQQIFPFALKNAGLTVNDVWGVIPTHCHDDHVGSLGMLGLKRYDFINKPRHFYEAKKPYAPKLIMNENLVEGITDVTRGNFRTVEGFVATLDTFFEPIVLKDNESFGFEGWSIQLVQQIHVMTGNSLMHTYGVFGEKGDNSFFITSDTQYFQPRQVHYFYNKAKFIITDCETLGTNLQFAEGELVYKDAEGTYEKWPEDYMKQLELGASGIVSEKWKSLKFMSGVHSTYAELAGYPSANAMILSPEVRSKIWLSHYGDHVTENKDAFGNPVNWDEQAKKDGLAGFVKLGQVFEL